MSFKWGNFYLGGGVPLTNENLRNARIAALEAYKDDNLFIDLFQLVHPGYLNRLIEQIKKEKL